MHEAVRELEPRDAAACDAIVAGLPEWFGNEQGIRECALAVRSHAGTVATDEAGVTGILTWTFDRGVAEITWMAVRATSRRRGIGRSLLDARLLPGQRVRVGCGIGHMGRRQPRRAPAPFAVTAATPRHHGTSCTSCRYRTDRARCVEPCR